MFPETVVTTFDDAVNLNSPIHPDSVRGLEIRLNAYTTTESFHSIELHEPKTSQETKFSNIIQQITIASLKDNALFLPLLLKVAKLAISENLKDLALLCLRFIVDKLDNLDVSVYSPLPDNEAKFTRSSEKTVFKRYFNPELIDAYNLLTNLTLDVNEGLNILSRANKFSGICNLNSVIQCRKSIEFKSYLKRGDLLNVENMLDTCVDSQSLDLKSTNIAHKTMNSLHSLNQIELGLVHYSLGNKERAREILIDQVEGGFEYACVCEEDERILLLEKMRSVYIDNGELEKKRIACYYLARCYHEKGHIEMRNTRAAEALL